MLMGTRGFSRGDTMNGAATERFVAKLTEAGWIVGDRWSMRVFSRHATQVAAEYAARYWNRESGRAH